MNLWEFLSRHGYGVGWTFIAFCIIVSVTLTDIFG